MSAKLCSALIVLIVFATTVEAADRDPQAILRQSEEALRAARTLSYRAESSASGAMAEQVPDARGTVNLASVAGAELPKLFIEFELSPRGTVGGEVRAQVASDGSEVTLLDLTNKRYAERALPSGAMLLNNASGLFIRELSLPAPFARELGAPTLKHEGTETVDGVACDVISAEYGPQQGAVRWYLAQSDHLPRRVERLVDTPKGRLTLSTDLTALQVNPTLAADLFDLPKPADFEDGTVPRRSDPSLLAPGSPAPDFTLKSSTGDEVVLQDLRGNLVLLDFWATWCGPCRMAMPGIQKLHEKYAGKPVRIFGVNCREKSRTVDAAAFVRELGFTYPQLLDGDRVALDYRVRGIPAFYLIGPDGKVLFAQAGFTPAAEAQISRLIDETLKALPSASAAGG